MRRPRPWTILPPAILAFALAAPATAFADRSGSSNWSGYAVHRAGTSFSHVSGSWRQPKGNCTAGGGATFSAFWVGLGGYAQDSMSIEQLGTEFDCSGGQATMSAWYELLPAPVQLISMRVASGDQMTGDVQIAGTDVTLTLQDLTRGELFSRTMVDNSIDQSSAEWITEAPSQCVSTNQCRPLPLSNFGSVRFSRASAQNSGGQTGSISSPIWKSTQIVLAWPARYVALSTDPSGHQAMPSRLRSGGQSFTVSVGGSRPKTSTPSKRDTVSADGVGATGAGSGDAPGGYYPGSGSGSSGW